jgi:peptide/nickel transport system substrate-binding protein
VTLRVAALLLALLVWAVPAQAEEKALSPEQQLLQEAFGKPTADTTQTKKAERTQLVIGVSQAPGTMNPLLDSLLIQQYILALVRRPITAIDAEWNLVCLLCTSIPTLQNGQAVLETYGQNQKGIAVTVQLKPEARWGDGTPVSSTDMVFTWKLAKHPSVGAVSAESFRRIRDITVKDAKTFTLHLDRVTYDYNQLGNIELMPAHIEKLALRGGGAAYRKQTRYDHDYDDPGLYNGPYRIVAINPGTEYVMERNKEWWGKEPFFKRIVVRVIPNTTALQASLFSGTVDMIAGEVGLNFEEALQLSERQDSPYVVQFKPSLSYEHIDLNLSNPLLKDKAVRQALLYAIDRDAINAYAFKNRQMIAQSFVNPLDKAIPQAGTRYAFDPKKAAALLDAAGWKMGEKGVRVKNGVPLRLEFNTTSGNRTRELVQQVLQNYWKRVGIEVFLRNKPARVLFSEGLVKRQYSAMALYAWASGPGSVPRTSLHGDYIPDGKGIIPVINLH